MIETIFLFFIVIIPTLILVSGLGVGLGFLFSWLIPALSFEIAMLLGAIYSCFSVFVFGKVLHIFPTELRGNLDNSKDLEYDDNAEEIDDTLSKSAKTIRRYKRRRGK